MSIIKSADARNVLPFPSRYVEPLLIDRAMEVNRLQLEERRHRRLAAVKWACAYLVLGVVSAAIGWWLAR